MKVFSTLSLTILPFDSWAFIITLLSCLQYKERKAGNRIFIGQLFFPGDTEVYEIVGNVIAALLLVYTCCQECNCAAFNCKGRCRNTKALIAGCFCPLGSELLGHQRVVKVIIFWIFFFWLFPVLA